MNDTTATRTTERARILVVEDENILAMDLSHQLEKNGYTVPGIYNSGEETLEHLPQDQPDLVLMDIQLQGEMDGVETAGIIKDRYKIPVVFLTAFADDTTFQRAKNIDPFGYIIKPFEERILRTTIEMALYKDQLDKQLIASEERYRNFFEDDLSGDFVTDSEGNIIECNTAFVNLFSFASKKEALGTNVNQYFKTREERQKFWQSLLENKQLKLEEFNLNSSDGKTVDVLANVIGSFKNGEIHEIKGYLIDTTERKRLEQQLQQSQKMEALGRLAGGVAHDFNNILTVIMGYSSMIKDKLNTGLSIEQDIEGIQKSAKKAVNLTRQLLVFSRKQTLKPTVVDINQLITDMQKMLRRLINENIGMHLFLHAENPTVYIDPGQMEQVLINLAVNAKDAMPEGGELIINTSNYRPTESEAREYNLSVDDYVIITVEDTGTGIDEQYLSKIFEPFFTTKSEEQGTGLGLSTVYAIIDQSNGHVKVDSVREKGTTFTIYLPQFKKKIEKEEKVEEEGTLTAGTETILVVEDEDNVRGLISKLLDRRGYKVLEARNAGEALLLCERHKEKIHLLITDVVLPIMRGDELAGRLKNIRPDIKFLFISGYIERKIEHEDIDPSEINFIQKPFEIEPFISKIREILDS